MNPGMAGEDASLDSAVASIAAKLRAPGGDVEPDARDNREDRDAIEREASSDLQESERMERDAQAGPQAEDEGESGTEAGADDDAFIELPAAEDGAAPERVPLAEAVEAVKQLRQMNGEIATAVIRAQDEAYEKQDEITQALNSDLTTLRNAGRRALQMMELYMPQPPDTRLIDMDPQEFYRQKAYYDEYVTHASRIEATIREAESHQATGYTKTSEAVVRRENERLARYVPAFKDEASAKARRAEIAQTLGERYGLTEQDLDGVWDHKAWRIMNDLADRIAKDRKAPEVRKQVQEKAPKLVNGRVPNSRDQQTGRFIAEADKELRERGTEDAFARKLMRSGALKGF